MSDPEVPKNEQPDSVDDVVAGANEGLDAAAAARDNVDGTAKPVDPALDAFAAAERDFPGTFGASADTPIYPEADAPDAVAEPAVDADTSAENATAAVDEPAVGGSDDTDSAASLTPPPADDESAVLPVTTAYAAADEAGTPTVADTAYGAGAASMASAAETQVVPAEPIAPPAVQQPIFVQAPEPPRELGNRGAAGAIGLVAAVAFGIFYMGAILGLGALDGKVTLDNIGTAALTALQTWSFWVPVVVFFLSFWLLGVFINRARWGKWVIFGLFAAVATYGGHVLGQLFQARFWNLTSAESAELVNTQLVAPLAIAAFIFAREITIWFGAWVSRSGAKKKALNAEAQAEYERTLEAGPSAMR